MSKLSASKELSSLKELSALKGLLLSNSCHLSDSVRCILSPLRELSPLRRYSLSESCLLSKSNHLKELSPLKELFVSPTHTHTPGNEPQRRTIYCTKSYVLQNLFHIIPTSTITAHQPEPMDASIYLHVFNRTLNMFTP